MRWNLLIIMNQQMNYIVKFNYKRRLRNMRLMKMKEERKKEDIDQCMIYEIF